MVVEMGGPVRTVGDPLALVLPTTRGQPWSADGRSSRRLSGNRPGVSISGDVVRTLDRISPSSAAAAA